MTYSGVVFRTFLPLLCWLPGLVLPTCSNTKQREASEARPAVAVEPVVRPFVKSRRLEPTRWLRFEEFHPAGDGRTDDAPQLREALKACQQQGAGLLIDPERTYFLDSEIDHAFTGVLSIKSSRADKPAVFRLPDSRLFPIRFSAEAGPLKTAPATPIKAGIDTLTLLSTAGMRPGDLIHIQSDEAWPIETGTRKGEHNLISHISGNVVHLKYPCQYSYGESETVSVTHARPATLNLINLEFQVQDTGDKPTAAVSIVHTQHSLMERVLIRDAQYACSQWYGCYDTEIRQCRFENANQQGQGYGIVTVGGLYYNIHDNSSAGCRKLCDFSGDEVFGTTRLSQAISNTAYGEGKTSQGKDLFSVQSFCVATHGGADGILIQGNTAFHCQTAFQLRGINLTLDNNRILGRCITAVALSGGRNHTITRNEYRSLLDEMSDAERTALDYSRYPHGVISIGKALLPDGKLEIRHNRFDFARDYGIYGEDVRQQCRIQGNQFTFYSLGQADREPVLLLFENQTAPLRHFSMRENTGNYNDPEANRIRYQTLLRGNSTHLLEWPTCEVQGLRASDLLTLRSSEAHSVLQKKDIQLVIDKKGQELKVSGNVRFLFERAALATLTGLPPARSGTDLPIHYETGKPGEELVGRLVGPTGELVLGAQAGTLGSSFAGGALFETTLQFLYHTN